MVKKKATRPARSPARVSAHALKFDPDNPNKGTSRGHDVVQQSLRRLGAGRSILIDKNGRTIAGNKTLKQAQELGLDVEIIETDGKHLVALKRTDLDVRTKKGRELSIADNRSSELGLDWDLDSMARAMDQGADLRGFFDSEEVKALRSQVAPAAVKETEIERPQEVVWVLLAIPVRDWPKHQAAVESMQKVARFSTTAMRPEDV